MGKHAGTGQLVETDYNNYLIGYSCDQLSETKKHQKINVVVRNPDTPEEEIRQVLQSV